MGVYNIDGELITEDAIVYKKNTFVSIYLNASSGEDTNDGLTTTTPVKTLERAFELGLLKGNEFRIGITDSSNYTLAARTVTGICIHIFAPDGCYPTITFNQLAFYNCHINFQGTATNSGITILCTDSTNGWYTDNSYSIFKKCNINSVYKQNGGNLEIEDCTLHDVKVNHADVRLNNVRMGNSLGRINAIFLQQGGTLSIESNGVSSVATELCSKMIDLDGVFANIQGSASGDLSQFTTRINANASIVLGSSSYINSYGATAVSGGGCILDGKTFIKP